MTTWATDKFIAFGSLLFTQSQTLGSNELKPHDFQFDSIYCKQCQDISKDFTVSKAIGVAYVRCPNGHNGQIHMLNDQDNSSPLASA